MTQNIADNLPTTYTPAPAYQAPAPAANTSIFSDMAAFEGAQRVCRMLASSDLVPQQFRGNIANTMIALELANRTGVSPFMCMQNLYVVHGRPGFSATYIIAAINSCGRFSPLRFDLDGEGDDRGCVAWVVEKATGDRLEGSRVTVAMAKREGWYGKQGSKWQTMPDQMLRYRAAAFFGRLYAPDILMGMQTAEELADIEVAEQYRRQPRRIRQAESAQAAEAVVVESADSGPASVAEINAMLKAEPAPAEPTAEAAAEPATKQPQTEPAEQTELPQAESPAADDGKPPQSEDELLAARRDVAMAYIAEIDAINDAQVLKGWAMKKGYKTLSCNMGGMESAEYKSVMQHINKRLQELEGKK